YVDGMADMRPLIAAGRRVVCLRTFSKIFGLAALRVGYGYMAHELAGLLQRVRQPFNVNAVAPAGAWAALGDTGCVGRCREANAAGLAQIHAACAARGWEYVPSCGNFVLIKVGEGRAAFQALQRAGVVVRPVDGYGLPEWVRVTVGTEAQNERMFRALE